MKAKQATAHPKLVTQLERHACSCPSTMHDQLNEVRVEVKASIAKVKPVPSHKASMFPSPMSGLATMKQPGEQQYCKQVPNVRAKVDHAIKRQTSKLQCNSLTQRNVQHQHVSSEVHRDLCARYKQQKHVALATPNPSPVVG